MVKEIKGLRGGVLAYAAYPNGHRQGIPQIDAEIAAVVAWLSYLIDNIIKTLLFRLI